MFKVDGETINICKDAFVKFMGTGLYVGLFLISILYVIAYMHKKDNKENKIKIVLGIYCIIIFILNLSPIFTKFITNILMEHETYWRVYWLLPIGISIAFCFTDMIFKKEGKKDKVLLVVLMFCIIILSGNYMYDSNNVEKFVKVDNYYKIPDNVLDIVQKISEDDEEYKKLAGSDVFIIYTRQIDGKIIVPESRNMNGNYSQSSIVSLIKNGKTKEICDYCKNNNCNYLVVDKNLEFPKEYILGYDIKKLYENEEYSLYKFNRILGNNN